MKFGIIARFKLNDISADSPVKLLVPTYINWLHIVFDATLNIPVFEPMLNMLLYPLIVLFLSINQFNVLYILLLLILLTFCVNNCSLYDSEGLYVINPTQHSPLIGFAYDGYPIYGP